MVPQWVYLTLADQITLLKRTDIEVGVEESGTADPFWGLSELIITEQQICEEVDFSALILDFEFGGRINVVSLKGSPNEEETFPGLFILLV